MGTREGSEGRNIMDQFTFGDSRAATNLVKILNDPDNAPCRNKVSNILSRWADYSNAVMDIQNPTICRGTLDMWRQHFLSSLRDDQIPTPVRSHAENVMVATYRKCRAIVDERAKELARQKRGIL
jgi:hypothetical protein